METLTFFIQDIYSEELGQESFQTFSKVSITNRNYKEIVISGSKLSECVFENVIFENCTFWSTKIDNSLFINCLFINCKFQFTEFTSCNFESSSIDNCIWGLSKLQGEETFINTDVKSNYNFESIIPSCKTITMNLAEILKGHSLIA